MHFTKKNSYFPRRLSFFFFFFFFFGGGGGGGRGGGVMDQCSILQRKRYILSSICLGKEYCQKRMSNFSSYFIYIQSLF